GASGLGEAELMDLLAELIRGQVLEETSAGRYRFVHQRFAEIGYERMGDARRRTLHRCVARSLEERAIPVAPEEYPALAHHWSAAAEEGKALHYLEQAGLHAFAAAAFAEAASFL